MSGDCGQKSGQRVPSRQFDIGKSLPGLRLRPACGGTATVQMRPVKRGLRGIFFENELGAWQGFPKREVVKAVRRTGIDLVPLAAGPIFG